MLVGSLDAKQIFYNWMLWVLNGNKVLISHKEYSTVVEVSLLTNMVNPIFQTG